MAGTKRKQSDDTKGGATIDLTSDDDSRTPSTTSTPSKKPHTTSEGPIEWEIVQVVESSVVSVPSPKVAARAPTVASAPALISKEVPHFGLLSPKATPQKPVRRSDSVMRGLPSVELPLPNEHNQSVETGAVAKGECEADTAALRPVSNTAPVGEPVGSPTTTPQPSTPSAESDCTPTHPTGLYAIPELATRYIPQTSTADNVEYTNPQKFGIKPPYWKRWTPAHYGRFAEHLRSQFDPVPFAQEYQLPVEEVQHVFTSIVCDPLYDADEAIRRGEEGMVAIFSLSNKYGTPSRHWGRVIEEGKKVYGELAEVKTGVVVLTTVAGNKKAILLTDLVGEDVVYLKQALSEKDKAVLWAGSGEVDVQVTGMQSRSWTGRTTGKSAVGRVTGLKRNAVTLTLESGTVREVPVDKFADEDVEYLMKALAPEFAGLLWPGQRK
ncbi:hypothetical protein LTR53_017450 [Teratosphaeriaceae sp. CCFEE 6253]|nr:hypothetical protein LTR53_017450 [Teratosphaeriaceae sp. CCFEE 6253]